MRNLIVLALLLFAVSFGFGLTTGDAAAIGGGGGGDCYYYCTCDGTPMKCCVYGSSEFCWPTDEFQCPQVYEC